MIIFFLELVKRIRMVKVDNFFVIGTTDLNAIHNQYLLPIYNFRKTNIYEISFLCFLFVLHSVMVVTVFFIWKSRKYLALHRKLYRIYIFFLSIFFLSCFWLFVSLISYFSICMFPYLLIALRLRTVCPSSFCNYCPKVLV